MVKLCIIYVLRDLSLESVDAVYKLVVNQRGCRNLHGLHNRMGLPSYKLVEKPPSKYSYLNIIHYGYYSYKRTN